LAESTDPPANTGHINRPLGIAAMSKTHHWVILVLSVALFLASLNFDAFYDDGSRSRAWASAWLLSIGWLAALDFIFAWLQTQP
jgi:hypothetical protein